MTDNLQDWHTPDKRHRKNHAAGSSGKSRRGKRSSSQKKKHAFSIDQFFAIRPKKIDFYDEPERLYEAQKYLHFR